MSAGARGVRGFLLAGFRPATARDTTAAAATSAANVVIVEVDTLEPSVISEPPEAGGDEPPSAPPSRRWWLGFSIAAGIFICMLIAAALIQIPYVAVSPGDASTAESRVQIVGSKDYHDPGSVLFVTVSERDLTLLDTVFAWIDPDTEIRRFDEYYGTKSPAQDRQENLKAMNSSKDFATYVALHKLGYPIKVINGGALVADTVPGAPSSKLLNRNDIIVGVDGHDIGLPSDIPLALKGHHVGDVIAIKVRRNGKSTVDTVSLALTKRADGAAIIGIIPAIPATVQFQFPFKVDIGTGAIGGPSAGLAFTLATIDRLTPGSLTGGKTVAVTGTIDLDGNVGAIGGLPQKTIAVMRANADLFIVPKSEMADAVKAAKGSRLRVIGVSTLDEALSVLQKEGGTPLPAAIAA